MDTLESKMQMEGQYGMGIEKHNDMRGCTVEPTEAG
jgi:hypothetical protein